MSQSHSSPHRRSGGRGRPHRPSHSSPARHSDVPPLHPTLEPPDIRAFTEWKLGDDLQGAISGMGISVPTPIQRLAIQPVLDGRDVIAKAETGTGKTLAFGAPMMAKIDPQRASVLGLVLCPTRELAEQVQKVLAALGAARGVKTALIVGGEPLEPQVAALKGGAQVVVGTPGRVLDLYKQRFLSFPWTEFAILDEADVMLEIGFIDDVKLILSYTPDERQTLLFSATFPPELLKLAREYTKNPVEVATASGVSTVDTIEQSWIGVDEDERALTLIRLVEQSEPDDVFLVFCDRRTEVDRLMRRLERLPWSIKALHGGYDQAARFRVMSAFRTGEVKVLVATDVASRGLDVAHVTHVVNYTSPHDITEYTHRIGRTGRAGRKGKAITLVGGMDRRRWNPILRDATWKIPEETAPQSTRGGRGRDRGERPARAERNAWPVDEEAPRHEARSPRRAAPSNPIERRGDRPATPAQPAGRPAADRWPVDEDARAEAARHRDLRPNRESPRPVSRPPARPAPSRRDEHAPRDERPLARDPDRRPIASRRDSPREPDPRRDSPREPDPRRDAPREHAPRQRSSRGPSERPERARRHAGEHGLGPARPEAPAPRTARREDARPPAPERARRPAERNPSTPRPAPTEERPPGTFERPMSGGLLGHAARRAPTPPPPREHGDRGRGGRRGRPDRRG